MSSADFLERWFESEPLKGTMSASGIIGTFLGPRSPGTAYVLLHHYMGEIDGTFRAWGFARGGTGGIAEAIARSAQSLGVQIRTRSRVDQVIVRDGKASGVALENGDEIYADVVVSSLDPRRSFLDLVNPQDLPAELVEAVRKYRFQGSSGKVNLALDAAPQLACWPGARTAFEPGRSRSVPASITSNTPTTMPSMETSRAQPYIDLIIPSMIDPDMAPPGKHVMSCFVQYAPYDLRNGTWEERREAFGDAVVDTLSEYFPNLKNIILHRQVLTPWDIEQTTGLTQGNIFQGELNLSQLFFLRPAVGYARYRRPSGIITCAVREPTRAAGISGASGRLAALEIIKTLELIEDELRSKRLSLGIGTGSAC